jgi:hypothetical protein
MASRGHTWFEDEQLLSGEEIVLEGKARVRMDTPPYWWEGELVLTSDRLFFLPSVDNPFLGRVAFWLFELTASGPAGRNAFHVRAPGDAALFKLLRPSLGKLIGAAARPWLRAIEAQTRGARPRSVFEADSPFRRAAG